MSLYIRRSSLLTLIVNRVKRHRGVKTTKLAGIIQTFEPMFERMELTHAYEAAIFYVLLISNPSFNFTELLREAKKIRRTISQRGLTKGRNFLVNTGILAKRLFAYNLDPDEYEQKGYIPVPPRMIFKENEEYLSEIYEPDDFLIRKRQVEDFYSVYDDNYGDYRMNMEKGCVTLHCSRKWIVSYIASIVTDTKLKVNSLSMLLSGLRVFEGAYRQYYVDLMERGGEIRVIFGGEEGLEELEETKELRNEYGPSIRVKYNPAISSTCKNLIIDDTLAMDGKELLVRNGDELSYITIVYLKEGEGIKNLRADFETLWKTSKDLL